MMRTIKRFLLGAAAGLVAFWAFILLKELRYLVWKSYYDWKSVLGEASAPLMFFSIFSRRTWEVLPLWLNLETVFAMALILFGGIYGAWTAHRPNRQRLFRGG